jgi:hypothetical protein
MKPGVSHTVAGTIAFVGVWAVEISHIIKIRSRILSTCQGLHREFSAGNAVI